MGTVSLEHKMIATFYRIWYTGICEDKRETVRLKNNIRRRILWKSKTLFYRDFTRTRPLVR